MAGQYETCREVGMSGPCPLSAGCLDDPGAVGRRADYQAVPGHTQGAWERKVRKAGPFAVALVAFALVAAVAMHRSTLRSGGAAAGGQGVQLVGEGGSEDEPVCSKEREDCSKTKCCADPGMQCYRKDDTFAMCKAECIEGSPDPNDKAPAPWDCAKLGERSNGTAPEFTPEVELAPWVEEECAKPGYPCEKSKCCAWGGMQCFEKSPGGWASCKNYCYPGAPDLDDKKSNTWACKKLGHRTPGTPLDPPAEAKLPAWVKDECSKPGEDCSKTKCCAWEGTQCFRKNDQFATCKASCDAGPDLMDAKPEMWSCEPLGPMTPGRGLDPPDDPKLPAWVDTFCAKPGTDCSKSRCCQQPGMQCYQKQEGWSTCRASCTPGPDPLDVDPHPWSCKAFGPRTPGKIPDQPLWQMKPAKWVAKKCAQEGEDCSKPACCAAPGRQCYEAKKGKATCMTTCAAGPDPADSAGEWSMCREIGSRTPGGLPPGLQGKPLDYQCTGLTTPDLWTPDAADDDVAIKMGTYNIEWWKLYKIEGGSRDPVGSFILQTGPYDIMAFQECNDPGWAFSNKKLHGVYNFIHDSTTGNSASGLCTAWAVGTWKMLEHGADWVGEDQHIKGQYYGKRATQWSRLINFRNDRTLLFLNHHGPLPVDSGGQCGGAATAQNLMRVIATHGQPGDFIILTGDFNAGKSSATVAELSKHLHHHFNGEIYGGVDSIFSNTEARDQTNLGGFGSDHDALSAVITLAGKPKPVKHEKCPEHPKCHCSWAARERCGSSGDDGSCCWRTCCNKYLEVVA